MVLQGGATTYAVIALCIRWGGGAVSRGNFDHLVSEFSGLGQQIHNHIRQHVLRERDITWANGLPPYATLGLKEDGTLIPDEEWAEIWAEARKAAGVEP